MLFKKLFLNLLVSFVCFCICFILLEIGIRLYEKSTKGIPISESIDAYKSEKFGWSGKKIFGDVNSFKLKILVLGDSFTHGLGVDETQMYYRVFQKMFNAEIFVYGGPGYGTLQEYMVLDQYVDEIQPDLIVLQFCSNDFINNHWELESRSYQNNNMMVRPYWVDGKVLYRFPRFLGGSRLVLSKYSRFFYRFFIAVDQYFADLANKGKVQSVERYLTEGNRYENLMHESIYIFKDLMQLFVQRAGNIPIIAFPTNTDNFYNDIFQQIAKENGILFTKRPPQVLEFFQNKTGKSFAISREAGHWNEDANQIIGRVLTEDILDFQHKGYLK